MRLNVDGVLGASNSTVGTQCEATPTALALRPCHAFDDSVVFEWVESDLLLYSVR